MPPTSPHERRRETDALIAELFDRQAGRVGHRQLLQASVSRKAINRRVASGRLIDVTDGPRNSNAANGAATDSIGRQMRAARVYGSTTAPTTQEATWWTALLAAPEGSAIGYLSACAVHDTCRPPSKVHVVHAGGSWAPPRGVVAHRTRRLDDVDLTEVNGVTCTTFARAAIDAAIGAPEEALNGVVDSAVKLQIYDELAMRRVIADRGFTREATRLARALDRLDELSGEFRSEFERRSTRLAQRSTLIPRLVVNVLVDGFRPDLLPVGTRGIIECDGRDYHRSLAQIARDAERERILRALGFAFLRLRWHHVVYEEERTLARIEQFVLANLAPPVPLVP